MLVLTEQIEVVEQRISEWESYIRSEKAANTARSYIEGFRIFRGFLAEQGLALTDVKPSVGRAWRDWMHEQGWKRGTINQRLTAARSFYDFLVTEHDLNIVNPLKKLRARGRPAEGFVRDELSSSDILALKRVCLEDDSRAAKRDWAILGLMAYTCMRSNECRMIDMEDFGTRGGENIVRVLGKGYVEKSQVVVISPKADEVLRPWLAVRGEKQGPLFVALSNRASGTRLSSRGMRQMWEKRKRQAGIVGNKSLHSLRHSAIMNAIRHGLPLEKAQLMARHRDISTTAKFYLHMDRFEDPGEHYIDYENGV